METIEKIRQEIEDYSATLTCIDADIAELKMSIQHCEEQKVKVQDIILELKQELRTLQDFEHDSCFHCIFSHGGECNMECKDIQPHHCEGCSNLGICATDICPAEISASITSL